MLFRKKIERSCAYCLRSAPVDDEQFLCIRKGLRTAEEKCWQFRYDPCKRIPPKARVLDFSKYKQEDFSL